MEHGSTQETGVETQRVSAIEVAEMLNKGVATIRLKRKGVNSPTPEQVIQEATKIAKSLVGQDLEQARAREQFNQDVAEWIGIVTGGGA